MPDRRRDHRTVCRRERDDGGCRFWRLRPALSMLPARKRREPPPSARREGNRAGTFSFQRHRSVPKRSDLNREKWNPQGCRLPLSAGCDAPQIPEWCAGRGLSLVKPPAPQGQRYFPAVYQRAVRGAPCRESRGEAKSLPRRPTGRSINCFSSVYLLKLQDVENAYSI